MHRCTTRRVFSGTGLDPVTKICAVDEEDAEEVDKLLLEIVGAVYITENRSLNSEGDVNVTEDVDDSPLVSMERKKGIRTAAVTAYGQSGWPLWHAAKKHNASLRAQAQLMRTETVETFELVKVEPKLLRKGRTREVREQALSFCISSSKLIC
ncbi:hypothetical protein TNCV_3327231 [Trichonephila clavipes]|nr:hypothetical protein TNCV_3327231 [Trichonephila clavipes]